MELLYGLLPLTRGQEVIMGQRHAFLLHPDGSTYAFGANGSGQLGLGDHNYKKKWTRLSLEQINKLTTRHNYTVAITDTGEWHSVGNSFVVNHLMKESWTGNWQKVKLPLEPTREVALGTYHCFLITERGNCYGRGFNWAKQLGLKEDTYQEHWASLPLPFPVQKLSCHTDHSLLLTETGACYGVGSNGHHRLGLEYCSTVEEWTLLFPSRVIREIFTGYYESTVLTKEGECYRTPCAQIISLEEDVEEVSKIGVAWFRVPFPNIKEVSILSRETFYHTQGRYYSPKQLTTGEPSLLPEHFTEHSFPKMPEDEEVVEAFIGGEIFLIFTKQGHWFYCLYGKDGQEGEWVAIPFA